MKIKKIDFDSNKESLLYINKDSPIINELGLMAGDRIELKTLKNSVIGDLIIINSTILKKDEIGLSNISFKKFSEKENTDIKISKIESIKSFKAIRDKMMLGKSFKKSDLQAIMKDIVNGYYSPSHIASFCSMWVMSDLSIDEIAYMTQAMVDAGDKIKWSYDIVVDKHCLGGIPANRTTNIVVPIVASYGLHIPKTSSRSITSPAGTADTMEVLTNVELDPEKFQEVVKKTNGCIAMGGGGKLSPADSIIINCRKYLSIDCDSQIVSSVLSKKIAAGSTDILIVAPVGPTAKIKNMIYFKKLKSLFEKVGKKLNVNVVFEYEDGTQPIGNGIGPALEATDIMKLFKNESDAPQDLKETSLQLAGKIIEFDKKKVKKGEGYKIAKEILESGKAYKKFMEIIEAQGGLKKIPVAKYTKDILATKSGIIKYMDNKKISKTCMILGCPEKKASGMYLYHHINDKVKKGDKLFKLHSESKGALEDGIKFVEENELVGIE